MSVVYVWRYRIQKKSFFSCCKRFERLQKSLIFSLYGHFSPKGQLRGRYQDAMVISKSHLPHCCTSRIQTGTSQPMTFFHYDPVYINLSSLKFWVIWLWDLNSHDFRFCKSRVVTKFGHYATLLGSFGKVTAN